MLQKEVGLGDVLNLIFVLPVLLHSPWKIVTNCNAILGDESQASLFSRLLSALLPSQLAPPPIPLITQVLLTP